MGKMTEPKEAESSALQVDVLDFRSDGGLACSDSALVLSNEANLRRVQFPVPDIYFGM